LSHVREKDIDEPELPRLPNFRNMSDEKIKSFGPRSEEEEDARTKEAEYREWCEEVESDPMDPDSRHAYQEVLEETGDGFCEGIDPNDREGWTDNMNRE
jgi:hypothetical protein